jgi:hypothetical protein
VRFIQRDTFEREFGFPGVLDDRYETGEKVDHNDHFPLKKETAPAASGIHPHKSPPAPTTKAFAACTT